jgi:hypothetical protein
MPLMIDDEDVNDILRGLRKLIVEEQKDTDRAYAEKASYAPQLQNGVRHLEAKLRKYEKREKEGKH